MATILIIEDEENLRFSIERTLSKAGHTVQQADSVQQALTLISRCEFDLLLTDINLGGQTGIDLIRQLKNESFGGSIIVMTAFGTVESAVDAMKLGAEEYLQKPLRLDELVLIVERVLNSRTQARRLELYDRLAGVQEPDQAIIGESPAWLETLAIADRLAQLPIPTERASRHPTPGGAIPTVLLLGPTGTGKGVLARRIHDGSPESDPNAPFVHVNCAVLPPTLVESELFGHEKGAFTDASATREGFFEMAEGGTIFLDEIGEMPLALQSKILTVVEEGTFRRVGGSKDRFVRARLIAATNQDLADRVEKGEFRRDLFYRLNPFTITLPPLSERGGDAVLLAETLLARFASQYRREEMRLSETAKAGIANHTWPGNVRELINAVQRAAMLADASVITLRDLGLETNGDRMAQPQTSALALNGTNGTREIIFDFEHGTHTAEEVERALMTQALERSHGNVSKAARLIGMQRSSFRYRIERFGLEDLVLGIAKK